ncbi:hypothetical protein LTR97_004955 [Elasticomyces elasticus]|uniref:Uncharacterized protein n=1 Tax=Elasticomyces elasticus TaxID=574655 RepID=A0AAN7WBE0_9PEZI|nr:hypothetical protein LTR97_004955 [Elasticomyces elasticus]
MYQSRWAPKPDEQAEEDKANELRPTTSLSASALSFSPGPPPPDVSSNDSFAQTGAAQNELFDDVVPVDESMRVRSEDDLFSDDFTPVAQPVVERAPVRGRGDGQRNRGRGRGRGRGVAPGNAAPPTPAQAAPVIQADGAQKDTPAAPPEDAPSGPRREGVPSVRGDRRATGGLKKPKLTEDELAEKMAKISIRNAELSKAHAAAEADAASFAEREVQAKQQAAQKQKVERKDRQQMMGEREKNRMRKLKAMEGREWDAEKNEEDFQKGGRSDKHGAFAGDQQDYNDGREYLLRDVRGGGSRGGGRGGQTQPQRAPKQEEFPELPAKKQVDAAPGAESAVVNEASAPTDAKASWADQVESANT